MSRKRTVNRGWLKRMIQDGRVRARVSYSFDDMMGMRQDTAWLTARLSGGYDDFVAGQMNITEHDLRSKAGSAWRNDDGTITLYVHSNLILQLELIGGK